MSSKEAYVEDQFCAWVESIQDWAAIKIRRRGWPDRLIIGPGPTVFFIEFKRVGGKTKKLQDFIHIWLQKIGLPVYVCYTIETAKEIFCRHFHTEKIPD